MKEHGEHAYDLVVGDQGKTGEATKARHARETPVLELGDVGNVRDVLWSPSLDDASAQPLPVATVGTSVTMNSISGSRLKPPSVRSTRATGSATDTRVVAAPSNVVAALATA
jgi:hypothetical protein